jgi:hypothetical protein
VKPPLVPPEGPFCQKSGQVELKSCRDTETSRLREYHTSRWTEEGTEEEAAVVVVVVVVVEEAEVVAGGTVVEAEVAAGVEAVVEVVAEADAEVRATTFAFHFSHVGERKMLTAWRSCDGPSLWPSSPRRKQALASAQPVFLHVSQCCWPARKLLLHTLPPGVFVGGIESLRNENDDVCAHVVTSSCNATAAWLHAHG